MLLRRILADDDIALLLRRHGLGSWFGRAWLPLDLARRCSLLLSGERRDLVVGEPNGGHRSRRELQSASSCLFQRSLVVSFPRQTRSTMADWQPRYQMRLTDGAVKADAVMKQLATLGFAVLRGLISPDDVEPCRVCDAPSSSYSITHTTGHFW